MSKSSEAIAIHGTLDRQSVNDLLQDLLLRSCSEVVNQLNGSLDENLMHSESNFQRPSRTQHYYYLYKIIFLLLGGM